MNIFKDRSLCSFPTCQNITMHWLLYIVAGVYLLSNVAMAYVFSSEARDLHIKSITLFGVQFRHKSAKTVIACLYGFNWLPILLYNCCITSRPMRIIYTIGHPTVERGRTMQRTCNRSKSL